MSSWLKSLFQSNRRSFDRDPVDTQVILVIDGAEHACQIRDVSPGGAFLVGGPELPVGQEAVLRVPQVAIDTPVRVVRRTDQGAGILFLKDNAGAIIAGWTRGRSPA